MGHPFGGDKGVNVLIGSATADLTLCVEDVDFYDVITVCF